MPDQPVDDRPIRVDDARDDADEIDAARSVDACPRCGEHRLAVLEFPALTSTIFEPVSDAFGIITDARRPGVPGIGCLACGTEWSSLAEFRADRTDGVGQPARPGPDAHDERT
jgi:hypothetical protein